MKLMIAVLAAGSMGLGTAVSSLVAAPLDVSSPHLRALETFNYDEGPLQANDGGTGWNGAWFNSIATTDPATVQIPDFDTWPESSIMDTQNLPLALAEEDGNVVALRNVEARRRIAGDPIGAAGETVWFSALALRGGGKALTYLRLIDKGNQQSVSISLPASGGTNLTLRTGNLSTTTTGDVSGMKRGVWTIAKVDYVTEGNGSVYLWVLDEDDFTGTEDLTTWMPSIASATAVLEVTDGSLIPFDRVEIARNDGGQRIDRLHLHVIPEPAALSLLGIGGLMLLIRHRSALS